MEFCRSFPSVTFAVLTVDQSVEHGVELCWQQSQDSHAGGAIKLFEKLIFDATYEKIGVAMSHFGTHTDAVDLFVVVIGK